MNKHSLPHWPFDMNGIKPGNFPERFFQLFSDLEDDALITGWKPATDVKESEKEYLVSVDIPGVDPKNIEVTLDNGVLTIKGERSAETRDEKNGYRRVERFEGSFYRRLSLPDADHSKAVSAKSRNGVLEIRVPRRESGHATRVPVSAE